MAAFFATVVLAVVFLAAVFFVAAPLAGAFFELDRFAGALLAALTFAAGFAWLLTASTAEAIDPLRSAGTSVAGALDRSASSKAVFSSFWKPLDSRRSSLMVLPTWRAAPGSRDGPSTINAIKAMTISSPPPTLNMRGSVRGPPGVRITACQTSTVASRLPSLRRPPIGFAHRGARANAPENTLEAFRLAVRLGASGLESDAWCTADGVVVLDHDGVVRRGLRRVPIAAIDRRELPEHIPALEDLYAEVGTDLELSLDVKDATAFDGILAVARAAGGAALERLWLCHHDWRQLAEWRPRCDGARLVDSDFLGHMPGGPEQRVAALADAGVDALNLHHTEWSGGLAALVHRFGVHAFGWDAQFERILDELLDAGLDAVYSDHVDRMVAALGRLEG